MGNYRKNNNINTLRELFYMILFVLVFNSHSFSQELDSIVIDKLKTNLIDEEDKIEVDIKFYYGAKGIDRCCDIDMKRDRKKLESIIKFLELNKWYVIELGIHTDCEGREKYNQRISEIRGQHLKDELVTLGFGRTPKIKDRILVKGYGESDPLEICKCSDCTETQHENNNRLEIKLVEKIKFEEVSNTSRDLISKTDEIEFDSTEEMIVVIKVCVDQNGNVFSADYIPEKSTSQDEYFIKLATKNAYKYKFEPSLKIKQCGSILFKFREVIEEKKCP
jgi:hypothetical protein